MISPITSSYFSPSLHDTKHDSQSTLYHYRRYYSKMPGAAHKARRARQRRLEEEHAEQESASASTSKLNPEEWLQQEFQQAEQHLQKMINPVQQQNPCEEPWEDSIADRERAFQAARMCRLQYLDYLP